MDSKVGLFSDIGFLTESYIYAKYANIPFYIDSSKWSYKVNIGWHDYFSSLTEVSSYIRSQYSQIISCSHTSVPSLLKARKLKLRDYEHAIKEVFILNTVIQYKINSIFSSYGTYEALYIRRGDKIKNNESPYVTTEYIIKQCPFDASLPIYVQSDNYSEIDNVKRLLNKQVLSTASHNKFGANESDRQTMTLEEKEKDTYDFLIGIALCYSARKCYVDTYSNVSRFIKIYSPTTVTFYTISNEIPNYFSEKELSTSISYESSFH